MNRPSTPVPEADSGAFSPVENEPPLRWQRLLHLVPADEIGAGRRAALFTLIATVPIVAWAAATGNLWVDASGEQLLQHYGVVVRCLVAIPLLVLAEAALHKTASGIAPQFVASGLVAPESRDAFAQLNASMRRLRDSSLPWVVVVGVAFVVSVGAAPEPQADHLAWAREANGSLGFGGWWYVYVVRPLFLVLLLGSMWRLALVTLWMARIGRLDLALVPTHPDRVGGLGFVDKLPSGFAMVTFAVSAILASGLAHEVLHHGVTLVSLRPIIIGFALIWTLLLLIPLLVLVPVLAAARHKALAGYSALVSVHGRLVHRRWILRETVAESPLLGAPEIGPVADANAMYDAVKAMRSFPISRKSLLAILFPLALPLLVLVALRIPLKELLLKLVKSLV